MLLQSLIPKRRNGCKNKYVAQSIKPELKQLCQNNICREKMPVKSCQDKIY